VLAVVVAVFDGVVLVVARDAVEAVEAVEADVAESMGKSLCVY
jgi:hypothetical protein